MSSPRPRLANAVQAPEFTDGRVARQWASIEQRLPRRGGAARGFLYASWGLVPLMAAGVLWFAAQRSAVPTTGAVIESARTPVTVTLRDGSTLALDAQTKLRLMRDEEQAVDVDLGAGKASFDVTHVNGRAFRVHAGLVIVRVLGTRFEVARTTRDEGTHVQVAVARGVVEVQRRDGTGGVRRLTAGETWSALIPAQAVVRPSPGPEIKETPVAAEPPPALEAEPALEPSLSSSTLIPTDPTARRVSDQSFAFRDSKPTPSYRDTKTLGARERSGSAPGLLMRANLARRSGQMREAADAYTELLRRFPRDGRAGLAAFELGRIRMDALTQPKAAVEAFTVALRSSPRASFREDALARVVVASDMMGDAAACQSARQRYQKEFPGGVHALALAARCVSR